MANKKFFKLLIPDTRIYIFLITVLIGVITIYNYIVGIIGIILLAYLIIYNFKINSIRREEWTKYIEGLSSDIDSATKQSILNLPIPLTIVEIDGTITWYNSKFLEVVNKKDLLDKNIEDIIPGLDLRDIIHQKSQLDKKAIINERSFKVLYNIIKLSKDHMSNYTIMLYWIETTNYEFLKKKYNEEKTVITLIQVDNYDEVMLNTEENKRPLVIAEIEHRLNLWGYKTNGFIRKHGEDKFIAVFNSGSLEKLEARKFDILDEIRDINEGNRIPVTLSIGIGAEGDTILENYNYANAARDLSLGRGGDQAAVKKRDKISFYGGRTKPVEKTTKVKARVIAHALKQLIDQSKNVIVMGHKSTDLDALGAALGIYRAARNRDKQAFIVLKGYNPSIKIVMDKLYEKEEYKKAIITCEEALSKVEPTTLLVVVDTNRPTFTECPQLLDEADNVVVIDHHRKGTEFIEDTVLSYHEIYVSSTSELVTEILFYINDKMNIEQIEAEILLAGIAVDTKNFTFKTGVRTFEAAALLRRAGADTASVRQLFQDELDTLISRSQVVKGAKIIKDVVAVAVCEDTSSKAQLIAAQAADELLNIRGINTSFVLGKKDDKMIFISGRSMGETNVQVILEKLGGGGHMTVAGAQLTGYTMEEAKERLEKAIHEYFDEEEKG